MSFNLISNFILIFTIVGILILLLRRMPEVMEEKGQQLILGAPPKLNIERTRLMRYTAVDALKTFFQNILSKIWHFMLEAKDLKEGKILASNFSRIVTQSGKRVINIGAFSNLKRAEKFIAEGNLEAAEMVYYDIIKKHPHEYPAYEGLVKIYFQQKKHDEVAEVLQYLIIHNPSNDSYYAQFGKLLLSQKRYADAIEAYERSFTINNLIPARFANVGLCYQALGNLPKARENFKKALDLEPSNMQYLMMLVDALIRSEQRNEAKKYLEQALEMDPENALVRERLMQF